jgi:hypothetical protein
MISLPADPWVMSGEKGDWSAVHYQQHMNKLFLVFDLYFRTMKHMINIKMYRNGTESFFGLKGRPSVVRDVKIHNQPRPADET